MMESKVHQTLLFLLIFCSISCKSTEDTSDIFGFDAPTRSTIGKILSYYFAIKIVIYYRHKAVIFMLDST